MKLRKMAEKLLLNQLKRAALDEASQHALKQAAKPKKRGAAKASTTPDDAPAGERSNLDATLAARAAQLARRIAKGKQPAVDACLPTAEADALLAAQLMLEEVQGAGLAVADPQASGPMEHGDVLQVHGAMHLVSHTVACATGCCRPL